MAITWRNVAGPNTADVLRAAIAASAGIKEGITGIGEAAGSFGEDKTKIETDALIADLMKAETIKERENLLASADPSFLNMERASERAYELGGDERELTKVLAEEARAAETEQKLFDRDVAYDQTIFERDETYEEKINKREIEEAEELLKAEHKREDYVTMMDQKFETETELYASMQRDSEIETTFQNGLLLIADEFTKNQTLDDLEFTRARSLITQEAQLKKQAAQALAISTAAKEETLALIEKDLQIALKEIEEEEKTKQKKNELEAKQKEIELKAQIKKVEKSGIGLEKTINRATMNGVLSNEDIDFHAADKKAFGKMEELILGRETVTKAEFDEYVGDEVNWNDNKLGFLTNPNDFSFTFRGVRETFGKKSWANTGNLAGSLDGWGWGGTSDEVVNTLEAAILNKENDKLVHASSYKEMVAEYKKQNVIITKEMHNEAWRAYTARAKDGGIGFGVASVDGFMESLKPAK